MTRGVKGYLKNAARRRKPFFGIRMGFQQLLLSPGVPSIITVLIRASVHAAILSRDEDFLVLFQAESQENFLQGRDRATVLLGMLVQIPTVDDLKRTVSLRAIVRGLGYQDTYAIWAKLKERRSGVAAKRSFKVTLESILGAEEKRGHKPSGSSSGIETPCLVGVPTSNALGSQDRPLYGQL
ncbi:hypothetical protein ARMSODRAFT_982116 [Armillaria solidipes]|uniref:Uncharacterized protein n=1 Tax=Armillaria solidipes TaxID=1076256 RepID=A0A2H3AT41_9AGAR|nr:hypothetical protein ARMSODRAFT_982116 [Armillaria solidipes]